MSDSKELLKMVMEFEDIALNKMQEAMEKVGHQDTKNALKEMITAKSQNIDALHWLIMAESGKIEMSAQTETQENGATRLAKGKCPFSASELNKMGFNVTDEQLGRK